MKDIQKYFRKHYKTEDSDEGVVVPLPNGSFLRINDRFGNATYYNAEKDEEKYINCTKLREISKLPGLSFFETYFISNMK